MSDDEIIAYYGKVKPPLGSLKNYEERFFWEDPRQKYEDDEVWDVKPLVEKGVEQ